jgi:hypothetical protein
MPPQRIYFSQGKIASLLLPFLAYALIDFAYFGSTGNYSQTYLGQGGDPLTYIWCLHWWPWSALHGLNPLTSNYVWYPTGFHLAWGDSVPGAALLMLPVTLLGNAAIAFNVLTLLAPALAAASCFLLLRYLTRDTLAAWIAGYLFGFSAYQLGQMLGHLSLILIFPLPLILLLSIQRWRAEISFRCFLPCLTFLLLLLFSFSMELFASFCLFGGLAWLIALACGGKRERHGLALLGLEIGLASLLTGILALPWLYSLLSGRGDIPDLINSPSIYSADLLNYLLPTRLAWVSRLLPAAWSQGFAGSVSEQGAYLGPPLIAILLLWFREQADSRIAWILGSILLLVVVCSLGPTLILHGLYTNLAGPWRFFVRLPLIRLALPTRFSLYVSLLAALIVGFWLAAGRHRPGYWARLALGGLACLCLLPNPAQISWSKLPLSPLFTASQVAENFGPNATLLILPTPENFDKAMIWQWQSGMQFKQIGGYLGNAPPAFETWGFARVLSTGTIHADFAEELAILCAAHGITAIVAGPGARQSIVTALQALPWRHASFGDAMITYVPPLLDYPYYHIAGDYTAEQGDAWKWVGREVRISAQHHRYLLRVTGAWRPPGTGPAEVSLTSDGQVTQYRLAGADTVSLLLPAGATISLTSHSTYVPNDYYHNGDMRHFTVTVNLEDLDS